MAWLAPNTRQAIIWNNGDPTHWHIYVALGRDELINNWIVDSVKFLYVMMERNNCKYL